MEKSISFRSHLVSNALDLITRIGWHCSRTSQLIAGIVSQLAAYTEEGVPMRPSIFICNSIDELIKRAGVGEFVPLSETVSLVSAAAVVLKSSAPLCSRNWQIYIERSENGDTCKYGVFCGSSDPSSLTIDEVLFDNSMEKFPIVRIFQSTTNKVEVRTNAGERIEFRFNDDEDVTELKSQEHIVNLSQAIAVKCGPMKENFVGFMERVLSTAIMNSHGTLIAVLPSESKFPTKLQDMVVLNTPVRLYERFVRHIDEGKTAVSVSRLQAAAELVAGFISSDGITVFNDMGDVLGYRSFVRSDAVTRPASGGARSRAFAVLKELVGVDLTAAFFRSQDGKTEIAVGKLEVKNE
jgi:hypothetical protein